MKVVEIPIGTPTGPRLRDLPKAAKAGLVAWLALTATIPESFQGRRFRFEADDVPMEFTRALAALAPAYGIRFVFSRENLSDTLHRLGDKGIRAVCA